MLLFLFLSGQFEDCSLNSHFENTLPFFILGSEKRQKVCQQLPYFPWDFDKTMKSSSRCVYGSHWIRKMKGEGEFRILLLNGLFENSLPFFVVCSERHPKVHQNFLIFLETSSRSYHHTLSAFVRVIGPEWIREMAGDGGRFETRSLLRFLSSVSTQFTDFFPETMLLSPRLQQSILNRSCMINLDVWFCLKLFGTAGERRVGFEGHRLVFQILHHK